MSNKPKETNQKPAGGFLIAHFKRYILWRILMSISLESCHAKLQRVDETLTLLEKELQFILANEDFDVQQGIQEEKKRYVFSFQRRKVNLRISVLIGEVIHGLRSILDYLVWEFAIKSGSSFDKRNIMFPVCISEEKFKQVLISKKLKGVPEKYINFIESLQPYKTDDKENSVIKILHDLDIIDKHRLLIVVSHGLYMGNHITVNGNSTAPIEFIVDENDFFFNEITEDEELYWLNYETVEGNNAWNIDNNFQIEFVFENIGTHKRKSVQEVLRTIYGNISDILNIVKSI